MLKGKIAVITGGSSGIGKATAKQLYEAGATVIITGRSASAMEAAKNEIGDIDCIRCDVTSYDDWLALEKTVHAKYGRADMLLNIAGAAVAVEELAKQTKQQLDDAIAINLTGPMYGMQIFAPQFMKQASGTIINVASVCATHAWPGFAAYAAAKAGLLSLSKTAYVELRPYNIRVTCVIPGSSMTNFRKNANLPPVAYNENKLMPENVASVICDICSLPANTVVEEVTVWGIDQAVSPL